MYVSMCINMNKIFLHFANDRSREMIEKNPAPTQ